MKKNSRHRPFGMEILHEDLDIIVIDKSSGLLTVKANYEKERTAHHILTSYVRKGDMKSRKQIFVVHRLDRETSGVLVFAKSYRAMENLKQQWPGVEKKYLALVHGTMAEKNGTISSYLSENDDYEVSSVKNPSKGELAITKYRVLRENGRFSLLEINLVTGKKNQIRVHLSEKGHPVVNDDKYGRGRKVIGRLALHSQSLSFNHPYNGKRMTFEAPTPGIFNKLLV